MQKQSNLWMVVLGILAVVSVTVYVIGSRMEPRATPPAPKPTGTEILVLEVPAPPGGEGRAIYAGLKREGQLVAWGQGTLPATGIVEVAMQLMDPRTQMRNGEYELWASVHRRAEHQTCEPSQGDLYAHQTLQWPKVQRLLPVTEFALAERDLVPK